MKATNTLFILALSFSIFLSTKTVGAGPIPDVHEVVDPNDMMRRYEETQLGADVFRRRISGLERRMVAVEQASRRRSPVIEALSFVQDLDSSAGQLGSRLPSVLTSSIPGVANGLSDTASGSTDSSSGLTAVIIGSTGSIVDSQGGPLGKIIGNSASSVGNFVEIAKENPIVVDLNNAAASTVANIPGSTGSAAALINAENALDDEVSTVASHVATAPSL